MRCIDDIKHYNDIALYALISMLEWNEMILYCNCNKGIHKLFHQIRKLNALIHAVLNQIIPSSWAFYYVYCVLMWYKTNWKVLNPPRKFTGNLEIYVVHADTRYQHSMIEKKSFNHNENKCRNVRQLSLWYSIFFIFELQIFIIAKYL